MLLHCNLKRNILYVTGCDLQRYHINPYSFASDAHLSQLLQRHFDEGTFHVCAHFWFHSDMKNAVIGNNKQKANLIVLGAVPRFVSARLFSSYLLSFCSTLSDLTRQKQNTSNYQKYTMEFTILFLYLCFFIVSRLLYLLQQSSSSLELRTECAVVLGSLAMGTENNIKSLVDCHIIPALLQGWGGHSFTSAGGTSLGDPGLNHPLFCAHRSLVSRPGLH